MSTDRADPFALDVSGFTPADNVSTPRARPEVIRQVSEAHNFPSRTPTRLQRRRRTGRTVQINVKATAEVAERFIAISDAHRWPYGETLEHALAALERALTSK
jgi:hypothetical protein